MNLVSIGSISAARILADGFKDQREFITAIVPVTDTGSSTGIIRERFDMPAPGDVRAVLSALADVRDERCRLLKDLVQYRFAADRFPELGNTELGNMALGNLILAALTLMSGSFSQAVRECSRLLGVRGTVLPVTSANVHIKAILEDGEEVIGEKNVRRIGKAPIQEVMLAGGHAPLEAGIAEALEGADMILLGPGCLYTSVVACLVVPGLADLIHRSKATKVFCCNTTTTPGQTDGMSVGDHVMTILRYLGKHPPDYILLNDRRPDPEVETAHQADGVFPLLPSEKEVAEIRKQGTVPVLADLIESTWVEKRSLHKVDTIRHDAEKVRAVLIGL